MNNSLKISLYLLIFLSVFNFTAAIMAGSYIVGTLGGSVEISTYGVTFFGLGNACLFIFGREWEKRFGGIRSLFYSTFLFCFALYLIGSSSTFFFFNLSRFFAGVASGIFFPVSWALLNEHAREDQKKTMFAFLGFIVSVTPVLGAGFGGWLGYDLEWPWIFYSQIPFLLVIAFILWKHMPPYVSVPQRPFDITGYFFYLLFVISGVTAFTLAEQLDWYRSPLLCTLAALSILSFIFFILWENLTQNPCYNLKLFKKPIISISMIVLFFLFSAYFGMIILLALWLHIDVQYTPLWISLLIGHMAVASIILFWLAKKWIEKISSLWVVLLATIFFAISCFYSMRFNAEIDFFRLAVARTFAGFGLAFFYFPLFSLCIRALPKEEVSDGICLFQTIRLIAGSVGCIGYSTLWFVRRIFYHERLGEQLTVYSQQTSGFFSNISPYSSSELQSDALLSEALRIQGDALALADCFYLMGWVMVGVGVLILGYLVLEFRKKKLSQVKA